MMSSVLEKPSFCLKPRARLSKASSACFCGVRFSSFLIPNSFEDKFKKSIIKIEESPYVIISVRTDANEYMRALVDGAKLFAKTIGSEKKVISLFNYGNSEKQIQDLRITLEKIDSNAILFMDANDEKDLSILINIAQDYGIYFSTVFNKPANVWPWDFSKYWVTHTIPDAFLSGSLTAQEIAKKIDGKGNILVVEGRVNNTTNRERLKGLKSVLKNYPGIKILDSKAANWSRAESSILVTKWFTKYSVDDVQAIWAANDEMALGAIEVLKEMGVEKELAVSGVDGTAVRYDGGSVFLKNIDAVDVDSADFLF